MRLYDWRIITYISSFPGRPGKIRRDVTLGQILERIALGHKNLGRLFKLTAPKKKRRRNER